MAEGNFKDYLANRDEVKIKKYLYVLRPLINILWLKEREELVPMSFVEALSKVDVSAEARKAIDELLEVKKVINETHVGDTPMRYVRHWRFRVAMNWLRDGDLPIADMAEQLGYQSEAAFNRAFKTFTGQTPGAVRREARKAAQIDSAA